MTGSNICGNSVAIAMLATTAATAQRFDASRVEFSGGTSQETHSREAGSVVNDANRVSTMATLSGNARFITAFNKIKSLVVDGGDFEKVATGAIAYTSPGGNINFSLKYFSLGIVHRTRRFVHEAYHHDSHLNSLRANDMPGCRGWECGSEIKVERAADRFFMQMWGISKFNEDGN